jgi:catalase
MVDNLRHVDHDLAARVAEGLGLEQPEKPDSPTHGRSSPALSQENLLSGDPATRRVALLAADGVDVFQATAVRGRLAERGVLVDVLAPRGGSVQGDAESGTLEVDAPLSSAASVLYDAVVVPGGAEAARTLAGMPEARRFVAEAYRHGKPVGVLDDGTELAPWDGEPGVVTARTDGEAPEEFTEGFVRALAAHRFPERAGLIE